MLGPTHLRTVTRAFYQDFVERFLAVNRPQILRMPERTDTEIARKIDLLRELRNSGFLGRVHLWRELARMERRRGNDATAACYEFRIVHLLGHDKDQTLARTISTLAKSGYELEAEALSAIFSPQSERRSRCRELLDRAENNWKSYRPKTYELMDDRRISGAHRVSVIVSMYNAGTKLESFLRLISEQTLNAMGLMEVILVDSGSPSNERERFLTSPTVQKLSVLYARSPQRETIQSAWNRGVHLSRAPYLCFLGLDETLVPHALETLARELDQQPDIDWVQSSCRVTSVDAGGHFVSETGRFDRSGLVQNQTEFDKTCLSWVGALYRRSIHDRVGWYDERFRAAGDTEFKYRVAPYVQVKFLAESLGVFRDYPEERMTAHPRSQIEDIRAWLLHRTVAGVERRIGEGSREDFETFFYDALCHRKAHLAYRSSDVDAAIVIAEIAQSRYGPAFLSDELVALKQLNSLYRKLDQVDVSGVMPSIFEAICALSRIVMLERKFRCLSRPGWRPKFRYYNDTRVEFSSHVW